MVIPDLLTPTVDWARHYEKEFSENRQAQVTEMALAQLLREHPSNELLEDILLKVAAINSLYSTNIFANYQLAVHIQELEIDPLLREHSTDVVNRIACLKVGNKKRYVYSFATKYCSWHEPQAYPIYDKFVNQLLIWYQARDGFSVSPTTGWRDYTQSKKVVERFAEFYGLTSLSFKAIDKFLWTYGQELKERDLIQ